MMDLTGIKNAGREIFKQGEKAVIACKDIEGFREYVVWNYRIIDGKPAFFWGRYVNTHKEALKKFDLKEQGLYSGN